MSNFEDEKLSQDSSQYFRESAKIQEKEAERAQARVDWENDTFSGKPTEKEFLALNGGPPKTEKEIHDAAKSAANLKIENQQKIDGTSLDPQNMSADDKLRANLGKEKVEKAHEQVREKQRRERERSLNREGRSI